MIRKIAVIGPESTGKSTLCEQLAAEFNTVWVPEYARDYLTTYGPSYAYEDLIRIAEGQRNLEKKLENQARGGILFIDTEMIVMKVWSEFVFGKCETPILQELAAQDYSGYLLTRPDLPWAKDALREYPDLRSRELLYHTYRDHLVHQSKPWTEISGGYADRLRKAIRFIEKDIP